MRGAARQMEPMTIDEFLRFVDRRADEADEGWELIDGVPVMMVGGTLAHAVIAGNIDRALAPAARRHGCMSLRGFLVRANARSALEPDVVLRCGPMSSRSRYADDARIVFEVLSPSTMRRDRVVKFELYPAVPSLAQIVLVYQEQTRVESWSREGEEWNEEPLVLTMADEALPVPLVEASLGLRGIYQDVGLGPDL